MPPAYSPVHLSWTPGPFNRRLMRGLGRNLNNAIKYLHKSVVADISHQGHPGYHSLPGNAPFRQTGHLILSYKTMTDYRALVAYLYSNSPYVIPLEFGTHRMAARPHLRYNLFSRRAQIAAIVTRPI